VTLKLFSNIPRESRRIYFSAITLTFLFSVFLQARANGEFGAFINKQIFYPFVFKARSKLKTSILDPRLKIFAFDDGTVAYLKATDMKLPEWGDVFQGLSRKPDTKILIDKLFDAYPDQADVKQFNEKMKDVTSEQTVIITFAHPGGIRFREEIDPEAIYRLQKTVFKNPPTDVQISKEYQNMTLYGAGQTIVNSFKAFGIANYSGDNFITPFIELKSKKLVPHAALSIVGGISAKGEKIEILGNPIPTNHEGKILVNFFEPSIYRKSTFSILPVITRIKNGLDIPILHNGDYVVILPAMFTGNTDFVDSPYGLIPGGFHLIAVLNSALTNSWIKVYDDPGFFVILTTVLGLIIGFFSKSAWGIFGVTVTVVAVVSTSALVFIYDDLSIPCIFPAVGLMIGGICGVTLNIHSTAIEESRRNRELEVAALVQKSFFPTDGRILRNTSSCSALGTSESASECGGDWWGSFHKNGYSFHFIADAVGHGVPAALLTSVAYAVSRALELEIGRTVDSLMPSEILTVLNRVLISLGSPLTQMTFFIIRIHDVSGECIYANAGNPPALHIKKSTLGLDGKSKEKPTQLTAAGNVLGVYAESSYENYGITLEDGDKVVMFTDGLFENRTADEHSQLGKSWLRATLQRHAGRPIDDFMETVWRSYKVAIGTTPPDDDSTLLAIEFDRRKSSAKN